MRRAAFLPVPRRNGRGAARAGRGGGRACDKLPDAQRVSTGAVWQLYLVVYKKELKFDHEWLILTTHDAQ